ncbi:MAG TPA: hypothetical protein VN706_07995 [Gemmatimonadaceae bacterium]|nr:hypothetical protein [Gemmatimonadaceae bacterium]
MSHESNRAESVPALDDDAVCLASPTVLVDSIERNAASLYVPATGLALKVSRPAFELWLRFRRPTRIGDVLPEDAGRRNGARTCIASFMNKGLLVPHSAVLRDWSEARAKADAPAMRPSRWPAPKKGEEHAGH